MVKTLFYCLACHLLKGNYIYLSLAKTLNTMIMKKLMILLFLAASFQVAAQGNIKFGVTGGLLNADADVDLSLGDIFDIASIDAINNTGFYIGVISDIGVTDSFHVQPELTYGSAGDLSFVYLPIMAKYYLLPNKLNVQLGPQFTFSSNLDDIKKHYSRY